MRETLFILDPRCLQNQLLLELRRDGIYYKASGAALIGGMAVMLNHGVFQLPKHCEESEAGGMVIRTWRIPSKSGHYRLAEIVAERIRPASWSTFGGFNFLGLVWT